MSTLADSPVYSNLFGIIGVTSAMIFSAFGAAYGTYKSGIGIAIMAQNRPEQIMKGIIPVVMAGVIGIYGLVVAVVLAQGMNPSTYTLYKSFTDMGAGLSVGLSGWASGYATGIVADTGLRGAGQQPRIFAGLILMLVFASVMGLYGLIVALILNAAGNSA